MHQITAAVNGALVLFVISVGVRSQSGEDREITDSDWPYYDYFDGPESRPYDYFDGFRSRLAYRYFHGRRPRLNARDYFRASRPRLKACDHPEGPRPRQNAYDHSDGSRLRRRYPFEDDVGIHMRYKRSLDRPMHRISEYVSTRRPRRERSHAQIRFEIAKFLGLHQELDSDFRTGLPPARTVVSPSIDDKPEVESKCQPGFQYVSVARRCYKVVYEEHNWTSADQRCHDLHPEAHLVAITKEDENSALKTYLEQELAENSHIDVCKLDWWGNPSQMLWTSGRQLKETNCKEPFVWKLSNKTELPISFTHWLPNEPDCSENEEPCIHLIQMHDFRWNNIRCSQMFCPLCEYDPS